MIGLSAVKSESYSLSGRPCGCSDAGCNVIRSTTLTTRIFNAGMFCRSQLTAASVAGEVPDAEPGCAMTNGLIHREPLQLGLLAGNDDIHVVPAAQAVIR